MVQEIKLKPVQAHGQQLKDPGIQRELRDVQEYVNRVAFDIVNPAVVMVFVKGIYDDFTKRMTTALVFINNTRETINELHGIVRMRANPPVQFAKTTIDFDRKFMGTVKAGEAILVHLNIPVRGIDGDASFAAGDVSCEFADVRVTYEPA